MTLDALRGRGAFRCGCGARIAITVPDVAPSEQCAWKGCRFAGLRDYDVPLCEDHARRLKTQFSLGRDVEYKAGLMRRKALGETLSEEEQAILDAAEAARLAASARLATGHSRAEHEALSKVYFMRHDRIIKIGYSIDPQKRAQSLADAAILATEPGHRQLEEALHAKFGHLRLHGEWFSPGPDLIKYINKLRAKAGAKPITADGQNPSIAA